MTFWHFFIFLLLAVFVLWNVWMVLREIGETSDDDKWGD